MNPVAIDGVPLVKRWFAALTPSHKDQTDVAVVQTENEHVGNLIEIRQDPNVWAVDTGRSSMDLEPGEHQNVWDHTTCKVH